MLNRKIQLKAIELNDVARLIASIHDVPVPKQTLTIHEGLRMIYTGNVLAYQIHQDGLYEYIYEANSHVLYIHIEAKEKTHRMIDALISSGYVDEPLSHKPIKVTDFKQLQYFPIVYLHQNDYSEALYQHLSSKLKGNAYVVYGDEVMDEMISKHYQTNHQTFALLFNGDLLKFKYSNTTELSKQIISRIELYMSQRVYDFPFNFKQLHKHVLSTLILEASKSTQSTSNEYTFKVDTLKKKEEELLEKINKLENEMTYLKSRIEIAEAELNSKVHCPLVFKGQEKDLYDDEQKDMLLAILEEALEKNQSDENKEVILRILSLNRKGGKREEILMEIEAILKGMKRSLSSKDVEKLKRVGIEMDSASSKHQKGKFFDARYSVTFSSSSSDVYSGAVMYRTIRNQFF